MVGYACPRCGGKADRGSSTAAGVAGGAVGAMIYSAFGPMRCKACGPIPRAEFPPDTRRRIARGSVLLVMVAVVLLVGVLALLGYFQSYR